MSVSSTGRDGGSCTSEEEHASPAAAASSSSASLLTLPAPLKFLNVFESYNCLENGATLIDLRSEEECEAAHFEQAQHWDQEPEEFYRGDDAYTLLLLGDWASFPADAQQRVLRGVYYACGKILKNCYQMAPVADMQAAFPFLFHSHPGFKKWRTFPQHISDSVFLGSMCHADDEDMLAVLGVQRVLSLCASEPKGKGAKMVPQSAAGGAGGGAASASSKGGIVRSGRPWLDGINFPILSELTEVADEIQAATAAGQRILVHCQMGMSRSAAAVAAWLLLHKKEQLGLKSVEEAHAFLKTRRPIVRINDGFLMQLRQWHDTHAVAAAEGAAAAETGKLAGVGASAAEGVSEAGGRSTGSGKETAAVSAGSAAASTSLESSGSG